MTKNDLIACFSVLVFFSFAQRSDSLVRFRDLEFNTDMERSGFINFSETNKQSYLALFMAPYKENAAYSFSGALKKVNDCVTTLKTEIAGKTEPKKVKHIYKYVHNHFFEKYRNKISFSEIFLKGEYNCVSASALYALIFNYLDIPFKVMEAPRHVFLIAYPETHRILIESTSPGDGYNTYSESYVEQYVRALYTSKIISKYEFDTQPARELFEKYYYSSSDISLKELAGIQYSNYGIYAMDDQDYSAAAGHFKKAYFLNPDERDKYLLSSSLVSLVHTNNYKDVKMAECLALLCGYANIGDEYINNEFIKNEFFRLIEIQLITNSDFDKFDKSFSIIDEAISDSALKNDIDFFYHYELGRLGLLNLKPDVYINEHLEKAYLLKPSHVNLQTLIVAFLSQKIEKNKEVNSIVDILNSFGKKFDFLKSNKHFLNVKVNCMLEMAYQNFAYGNSDKGEIYLNEFENLRTGDMENNIEPDTYYVEKAYSEAAALYYKRGNKARSKSSLQKGLKHAPNSFALRSRLSQF